MPLAMPTNRSRSDDEHAVEPEAARLRAQLVRVRRTHGRGRVGEHEAALEPVHAAVPLELPPVVQRRGQPEVGHRLRRESAPGIPRCAPRARPSLAESARRGANVGAQVDGRERRVPVVRVHEHGLAARDRRQRTQRGDREARVATGVVEVVRARWTVDVRAREVLLAFNEVDARVRERMVGRRRRDARVEPPRSADRPGRGTTDRPARSSGAVAFTAS